MTDRCTIEECGRAPVAKGLCNTHYKEAKRREEGLSQRSPRGGGRALSPDLFARIDAVKGTVSRESWLAEAAEEKLERLARRTRARRAS